MPAYKIETPKNIDDIFSLDCFKFNEMKALFKLIFGHLEDFADQFNEIEKKLAGLSPPDLTPLYNQIKECNSRVTETEKYARSTREQLEQTETQLQGKIDLLDMNNEKDHEEFWKKLAALQNQIDDLKARPIANGNSEIDLSLICSKQQYLELLERLKLVEKRNIEQDERLTSNEIRIEKLEKMIKDPLEQIRLLNIRCDNLNLELNHKVSHQELYNELQKKANLSDHKVLEASHLRLTDVVNDLVNQFADRVENDKAHKLLQKNLKNLYDLFLSLKGEGNEDDPMFTAKGLKCASCAKGVINMLGFRADHLPWQNFPLKDPGLRMSKQGQGFSKLYKHSMAESSYYNLRTGVGHGSTPRDNRKETTDEPYTHQLHSSLDKGQKIHSAGARKVRPMTAKINHKNGF